MRIGFGTRIGRHMRIGATVPVRSYRKPKQPHYQTPTERADTSFDRLLAICVVLTFAFFGVAGVFFLLSLPH